MRVSSLSGDVEGEGFPYPLPSAPRPPPPPHTHPKRKGHGAGPRKRPRGHGLRVLENNRSPKNETGGSVRRHREAESPARRAARGEGAAVRSRPHPQWRRPVQRASWMHRAPAPPCGRVLVGCGTAPPGGAGLPISPLGAWLPTASLLYVCVLAFGGRGYFVFGLPINLQEVVLKMKLARETFRESSALDN